MTSGWVALSHHDTMGQTMPNPSQSPCMHHLSSRRPALTTSRTRAPASSSASSSSPVGTGPPCAASTRSATSSTTTTTSTATPAPTATAAAVTLAVGLGERSASTAPRAVCTRVRWCVALALALAPAKPPCRLAVRCRTVGRCWRSWLGHMDRHGQQIASDKAVPVQRLLLHCPAARRRVAELTVHRLVAILLSCSVNSGDKVASTEVDEVFGAIQTPFRRVDIHVSEGVPSQRGAVCWREDRVELLDEGRRC